MYLHLFKTDAFFINWIEYLPKQKYGSIQTPAFILFVFIAKLLGKKILWVLHNKYSHTKLAQSDGSNTKKKFLFEFMIKQSHLILTHSNAGVAFLNEKFPKHAHKAKYVIHPVEKLYPVTPKLDKEYDLLIWGTIHAYKGIIEFLNSTSRAGYLKEIKIAIIGICPDPELKSALNKYLSENIIHHDKFFDFKEIAEYANKSRYVLFTYNSDTVLSSGSLMDSICMGASIIGPEKGAFKDLSNYSFIDIYNNYEEIFEIINNSKHTKSQPKIHEIEEFCETNNWTNFIKNAGPELKSVLG